MHIFQKLSLAFPLRGIYIAFAEDLLRGDFLRVFAHEFAGLPLPTVLEAFALLDVLIVHKGGQLQERYNDKGIRSQIRRSMDSMRRSGVGKSI